jgi:hypothetical protein
MSEEGKRKCGTRSIGGALGERQRCSRSCRLPYAARSVKYANLSRMSPIFTIFIFQTLYRCLLREGFEKTYRSSLQPSR